jgi:hypothetical protein
MTPWFKHQPCPDPIQVFQKILTLFEHVFPFQKRYSTGNKSDRIATGMGVNAGEGTSRRHKKLKD